MNASKLISLSKLSRKSITPELSNKIFDSDRIAFIKYFSQLKFENKKLTPEQEETIKSDISNVIMLLEKSIYKFYFVKNEDELTSLILYNLALGTHSWSDIIFKRDFYDFTNKQIIFITDKYGDFEIFTINFENHKREYTNNKYVNQLLYSLSFAGTSQNTLTTRNILDDIIDIYDEHLKSDLKLAVSFYFTSFLRPQTEKSNEKVLNCIKKYYSSRNAFDYDEFQLLLEILKQHEGRLPELEDAIKLDIKCSFIYATKTIGMRFKEGEPVIAKNLAQWKVYKQHFDNDFKYA
jgi:hypothetical protein